MTLVLGIKKGRSRAQFMKDAKAAGVTLHPVKGLPRFFTADGTLQDFLLAGHTAISSLDEDKLVTATAANSFTLDTAMEGGCWSLARHIRRDPPWNPARLKHPIPTYYRAEREGDGVDIYIIDSGVRSTHDEVTGRVTNFYDTFGGSGEDDQGHGTQIASVAAGNTRGFAREALIWSAKCFNSSLVGSDAQVLLGLGEILDHYNSRSATGRPAVLTVSFFTGASTVGDAIDDLIDAGITVVTSAGNDATDLDGLTYYPGATPDVIVVGAIYANDTQTVFTNDGTGTKGVDILAAGSRLHAAHYTGDDVYTIVSGTSFSTPVVAGVVACMLTGKTRPTTRTQVQAIRAKLLANATTGRLSLQAHFGNDDLPDRILYLDPDATTETIDGVS